MPEKKIKLLFVIGQFVQSGSERYLFELCRALDKEKFEIEILTRRSINESDYYYFKLRDMGFTIHKKMLQRRYFRHYFPALSRMKATKRIMNFLHTILTKCVLRGFFDSYDVINIIQIQNYYTLQRFFDDNDRLIIYLMSNQFQTDYDTYAECLPEREYRFVIMDPAQREDIRDSNCDSAEMLYFPLVMDFSGRRSVFTLPELDGPVKIGIFMRLSPQRPIKFFFYAFRDLLRDIDATLHIYGRGNPHIFYRTLDMLHIRERVFFEGHQKNIEETLQRDDLSVVWLTSNGSVLGYASIEVASFGTPMVFWNLSTSSYKEILTRTNGAIHSFSTVSEFVYFNKEILLCPGKLKLLGQELHDYVVSEHDIAKHIKILEDYYVRFAHFQGGFGDSAASWV